MGVETQRKWKCRPKESGHACQKESGGGDSKSAGKWKWILRKWREFERMWKWRPKVSGSGDSKKGGGAEIIAVGSRS